MKIEINNNQTLRRTNNRNIRTLIQHLLRRVARRDPDKSWETISVLLTDDIGITKINSAHLAKHESTDVISFCFEPMPGGEKTSCAEVVVNVQRAIEEGNRRKAWSASKELSLYLAHGCDHLSGAVDSTPTERSRMRRRELRWLKDAPAIGKDNKHSTIEHLFAE